ncbi:tRNA (adenosine(37)-N6)-threonylcarbamoyltransferase complex transferase subunit TsaD [Legionella quinlivanii]|uniref:tRNA (adenosine(37)-N6)-threonylcarbamoyltransferase complex transferase subunit TsaD n=1 Tax=Legionella quinlivanii TaxID=45073 RepID=UPI0022432328|nr:tRNA (adenosine(37)-N6)-threonylcarbamoyltransferase complex transferase subunit TsaD [Legionella quinlivanii]MCW8451722.1 tRNA (adenosine(37)-N6)-threonylcarbamoyltransferase complex transferase subunit TsaD [Legionella quinlivanii]
MLVLGIESSCDETGLALYDSDKGLLAHALYSQIALHQQYGGVVPELASRDHINHLVPLLDEILSKSGLEKSAIDAIAYTAGPGLIGALLVGACFAKTLAFALQIPALAVHHLEAHILVAKMQAKELDFPFLALLVSGGHTQLIEINELNEYRLLGESVDDAVGEAFDKTAKLMGIAYPGGAQLAKLADTCPAHLRNSLPAFPRPMTDRPGLNFSFSGLKTHALNAWNHSDKSEESKSAIAYAFQQAIVDTLLIKCKRAMESTQANTLVVAGGVGANLKLRQSLESMTAQLGGRVFFPPLEFCTDNGAMIAYTGCLHLLAGRQDNDAAIDVKARWPL